MVLRSGRDASTRPQGKAVPQPAPSSEQPSSELSRLTSLPGDSVGRSAIENSEMLGQNQNRKVPRAFLANSGDPPGGSGDSSGDESLLPSLDSRRSLGSRRSQGTLRSHRGTIGSRRSQVLHSSVRQDTGHGSSSPGDSSDGISRFERPLSSLRSGTSFSRTTNRLTNENPGESLREIRKRLASLEKEKELVSLTRRLNKMEAEKAAGFPLSHSHSSTLSESPEEALIRRQIIQESKLTVPMVKAYSGSNYAAYQSFIRSCEHVFRTRPVTYRKDVDKVLYGIGALEGNPSTTWYRHEEKFGRLDMSWDTFKTFLLDDLFPPEIRLRDVHKKYREAKQKPGQNVHGLIRYLEELEAQMVPVTEDHQMSTILGALHPWIEAQVSSRLESPKTKSELVQLALKVESTSSFRPSSTSNVAGRGNQMPVRDVGDSTRLGKRGRNDNDGPGFPVTKPRRDEPTERQGQRDFSKTKCYNCGEMGHIKDQCTLPHHEAGKA